MSRDVFRYLSPGCQFAGVDLFDVMGTSLTNVTADVVRFRVAPDAGHRSEFYVEEVKSVDHEELDEDEMVGKRYVAVANGAIRAEFDLESEKVGKVRTGEVIEVLSARKNDAGIMRVELKGGWMSTFARDGKRLLKRTDDDAELSNIVVSETEEAKEAAIAEAEAFAAAQTLNKEYQVKLKGSGKVTVQLSAMGVQVTLKKGKAPTTYLYQTLGAWGITDKGFEMNTSDGKTMTFECDERDAEELTDGMTKHAKDLAKAQQAASTPTPPRRLHSNRPTRRPRRVGPGRRPPEQPKERRLGRRRPVAGWLFRGRLRSHRNERHLRATAGVRS